MTRQRRHQWEPAGDGKVRCTRCYVELKVDEARRGAGPCAARRSGKALTSSPSRIIPSTPIIELGNCGACEQPLKQVPFNSRSDMIACVNRRCELYRQRLRYVPALSVAERKAIKDAKG